MECKKMKIEAEDVRKELYDLLHVDRLSLFLPDDHKNGSWFHQTSLSKHGQELRKPFVWSAPLNTLLINKFFVDDVGEVSIPVAHQNFYKLVEASNHTTNNLETLANCANNECSYLEACKILIPSTRQFDFKTQVYGLAKMALEEALGFSLTRLNFKLDCCFKGLLLCQTGQKISLFNPHNSNPGMLATVIIDLPVEDGFIGGLLTASLAGIKTDFSFPQQTSDISHISIISHDNHDTVIEPVQCGKRILMVFHLVWIDATLLGDCFDTRLVPEFLRRARRVSDLLTACWEPFYQGVWVPRKNGLHSVEEQTPTVRSVGDATNSGSEANPRQLLFPLQYHKFMNNLSTYFRLPAEDRFALSILSLVSFLDVNLAIVSTDVDATNDDFANSSNANVVKWFSSVNEFTANAEKSKFNLKTQMIGSFEVSLERESDEMTASYDYYYAALVIQPRVESILLNCRRSFDAVLEHLEKRIPTVLTEDPVAQSLTREQLLMDLQVILDFCRSDPLKVWCKPAVVDCDLNITKRLWQLCLRLRAREEGLELLKILSTDIAVTPDEDEIDLGAIGLKIHQGQIYSFCELIRDSDIVRLIAEFVCSVAGWDACAESILSMITLERLYGRLFFMSYLAQQIHSKGLSNGAIRIIEKVSNVLNNVNREQSYGFGPCDTRPFVALVLYLMDCAKPEERIRCLSFLHYYSNFDPYDLYYMVVGFNWQFDRSIDTCQDLYRELCGLLSTAAFETSERMCDIDLVELVNLFHKAGNTNNTENLINNICRRGARDEPSNTPLLLWSFSLTFGSSSVEQKDIDKGLAMLRAIDSVDCAREIVFTWLDNRVSELEEFVDKDKDASVESLRRRYDYFIKEVTCYFLLILLAEKVPSMSNPKRLDLMCSVLPNFSTKLLCHLEHVACALEDEMENCSAVETIFTHLSEEVNSRDESEVVKQLGRLDLVRSFVSEGDSIMNERTFATETVLSDDYDNSIESGNNESFSEDASEKESSMVISADR